MLVLLDGLCADCKGTFTLQYTLFETIPHDGHEVHFLLPDANPMLSADTDRSDLSSWHLKRRPANGKRQDISQ